VHKKQARFYNSEFGPAGFRCAWQFGQRPEKKRLREQTSERQQVRSSHNKRMVNNQLAEALLRHFRFADSAGGHSES
jgi:hypothetical protein